ncbi:serpentine receptor, putative [Plasmodium malariae]|uniref:Serpentine receptor, putative n=1 Tax=Plasmodium malariae TaxID=5858 RepID=A0A1D3JLQ8_PLAMA|nr:serpentine receptor, putative [Plasmodium malariae]SBT87532.1 serpentine receptor, putative [Plasmodium malariae]
MGRVLLRKRLLLFLFLLLYITNIDEDNFLKECEKGLCVRVYEGGTNNNYNSNNYNDNNYNNYINNNYNDNNYNDNNYNSNNYNDNNYNSNNYNNNYNSKIYYAFLLVQYVKEMKVHVINLLLRGANISPIFVSSKVIYGLYNDRNYSKISNFCYTKNLQKNGIVKLSNLFVPNTKFLILDKTDDEIYNYAQNRKGKHCADLEKEALFMHSFNDVSPEYLKTSYFVYEKDINNKLTEKNLNFILLNCGKKYKNAFKIEFRNNMNFLKDQFSCEDQEIYMLLMVILSFLFLVYYRKREVLRRGNNALIESVHCAILFFFFSNILYFVHIISYAFNGSGFSVLKVLSQIYESIFDCFVISILCYILNRRNNKAKSVDTYRTSLIYAVLKFLYTLSEIQNHQNLNLYSSMHSVIALPFVLHRIFIAVLIYNNSKNLLKEKKNMDEKLFIIFDTLLYNSWILSIPVLYFFMKNFSVHFTHLFIHFVNLSILIYLVYNISGKKYEQLESKYPYIDLQ